MGKKKSFVLRVQPEIYDALERWASDEFRSVNGQIEYLLQQALKSAGRKRVKKSEPDDEKNDFIGNQGLEVLKLKSYQ